MAADLHFSRWPAWRPVAGIELGAAARGIKQGDATDLALVRLPEGSTCAAVFTRSRFRAAPVTVGAEHLARSEEAARPTPRQEGVHRADAAAEAR